jgi:Ni/Co efflux regulator RcnB
MVRKLALLLSILAVSKVAFANTGSQGSAVVVEESHKKVHEEHSKSSEEHEKGHEHHHGKKGSASK